MSNFKFLLVTVAVTSVGLVCLLGTFYLTSSSPSNHHHDEPHARGLVRIPLVDYRNQEWWLTLGFGTPAQTFSLTIDTSAGWLWLRSSDCNTTHCTDHKRFNRTASRTYKQLDKSVEFVDRGRTIRGTLGADSVRSYTGNFTIESQAFLAADALNGDLLGRGWTDGKLGLGLERMNNQSTLFERLLEANLVREPVFSVFIELNETKSPDGELIFGGWDQKYFTGNITYAPLSSNTSWRFRVDQVGAESDTAGDGRLVRISGRSFEAQVDTSQRYISGPRAQVEALNSLLNATQRRAGGHYLTDCNWTGKPDLVFVISDRKFVIEPRLYVTAYPPGTWPAQICCTAIRDAPDGLDHWTLGALFVGSHYTVFDYGNRRLGFAGAK